MDYVVIETGGKQYRVEPGAVIKVDNLNAKKDDSISFDSVLLRVSGDNIQIGKPYLDNVSVSARVIDNVRGDKIRVSKFKAKSRYRKVIGFRSSLTEVKIEKIAEKKAQTEKKVREK